MPLAPLPFRSDASRRKNRKSLGPCSRRGRAGQRDAGPRGGAQAHGARPSFGQASLDLRGETAAGPHEKDDAIEGRARGRPDHPGGLAELDASNVIRRGTTADVAITPGPTPGEGT